MIIIAVLSLKLESFLFVNTKRQKCWLFHQQREADEIIILLIPTNKDSSRTFILAATFFRQKKVSEEIKGVQGA